MTGKNYADVSTEHKAVMEELRKLMSKTVDLLKPENVSHEAAETMAIYLTTIRVALVEWADLENRNMTAGMTVEEIRALRDRARELEGMVKELRNNLERNKWGPRVPGKKSI